MLDDRLVISNIKLYIYTIKNDKTFQVIADHYVTGIVCVVFDVSGFLERKNAETFIFAGLLARCHGKVKY